MKGAFALLMLRMMSIMIVVVINVLVIKLLPLSEVGAYYTLGTIAYFGNALFFVGFDFALQRKIRNISNTKLLDYSSLRDYCAKALPFGIVAVFALSSVVFFMGNVQDWLETALICAALSAINFMVSLSRNILQIAGEKFRVSYSLFLEQVAKLGISYTLLFYWEASAIIVIVAFIIAGLLSLFFNYVQMIRCLKPVAEPASYAIDASDMAKIFLPVSAGGVLNWLQLQSYRPVFGQLFQQSELVGAVSFLTAIGASAASATLGVLAQIWTPQQFATNGKASRRYIQLAGVSILVLTLLAYPVAYVFLRFLGKEQLYGLEYLVSFGVIVEGGNFILGVLGNHSSLTRRSFIPSMLAGIVGLVTLITIILTLNSYQGVGFGTIGFALVISQCAAVTALLRILLRTPPSRTHT